MDEPHKRHPIESYPPNDPRLGSPSAVHAGRSWRAGTSASPARAAAGVRPMCGKSPVNQVPAKSAVCRLTRGKDVGSQVHVTQPQATLPAPGHARTRLHVRMHAGEMCPRAQDLAPREGRALSLKHATETGLSALFLWLDCPLHGRFVLAQVPPRQITEIQEFPPKVQLIARTV